jgi:hypothetical protein
VSGVPFKRSLVGQFPGLTRNVGCKNQKSSSGQVYNSELGSFALLHIEGMICIQPLLELYTRSRDMYYKTFYDHNLQIFVIS